MAQWYPVFEAKEFDVVVELPDETLLWDVDPLWFNRILDNVFQNVVRHAEQVGTSAYMIDRDNQWILVINDKALASATSRLKRRRDRFVHCIDDGQGDGDAMGNEIRRKRKFVLYLD